MAHSKPSRKKIKGVNIVKVGRNKFMKYYITEQLIKIGHRRFKQILHYKPVYK